MLKPIRLSAECYDKHFAILLCSIDLFTGKAYNQSNTTENRSFFMKILLAACNAKYIHSNLAVYNLRAYAEDYRKNIVLKEYTINQQKDEILRDIYLEKPDVICFSCYIWNISFVKEIAEDLKKILPDSVFWAGGPEVSFDAEDFLKKNPGFFGVMVGEGEETFRELCRFYVDKKGSL